MSLILTTPTNPGVASWTDGGSAVVTNTPVRSIMSTVAVTVTNPNNVFNSGNSAFTGSAATTVTVPYTGTWIVSVSSTLSRNGAVAGTILQQSAYLIVTVDGSIVVAAGSLSTRTLDTDQGLYPALLNYRVALTAAQTVGCNFGFGAVQAGSLTASAGTVLSISPTQ